MKHLIDDYFKALETGNYHLMLSLFAGNAIVHSPLFGQMNAIDFYKKLFSITEESKISMINIFKGENEGTYATHFRYNWTLKNGDDAGFECVDLFSTDKDGKIQNLKIIYDTASIRNEIELLQT